MSGDQYQAALQRWHPDWLQDPDNMDQLDRHLLQEDHCWEDDEDVPLDEMFLMEDPSAAFQLTSSETQLAEGLMDDMTMDGEFTNNEDWMCFVKFVKSFRRDLLGKGYDTAQKCLACYRNYEDHFKRNQGPRYREWKIPHLCTITHPMLERSRYPASNEPITEEFKTYAYYALMESPDSEKIYYMMQLNGDNGLFEEMLEYAKFYQLWYLEWTSIVETYLEMKIQSPGYADGYKSYQEHHVVPIKERRNESRSYENLVWESHRNKREAVNHWLSRNRDQALKYLRARRHHEHDRRYNPTIPEFSLAPPAGMERIARSQMDYSVFKEEKYQNEVEEVTMFGENKELDYDYLEMLGEGFNEVGMLHVTGNNPNNPGVLPKMDQLYKESLMDPEVLEYEKKRRLRQEKLPHAVPWPKREHKQPDQILLTEPYGQEDGVYLTRMRSAVAGPYQEGELQARNSDDILARISVLSLAEPVTQTEHNTPIERKIKLLDMDQVVKYNKKLISIFKDVIDHIGPETVAAPTEWEFTAALHYLSNKKLECGKWQRVAAVKSGDKERKDLFLYYNSVKQHIHNTARDMAHEVRYTMDHLKEFVETVRAADQDLISCWFEDAVGPSCRQYMADLNCKTQQIENLMKAVNKLKVYKSLMSYKDTEEQTLFDDDIYHAIQKLNREIEGLKESLKTKEWKVEVGNKTIAFVKKQAEDVDKSSEKHTNQMEALDVYMNSLKRNVDAEKQTAKKIESQTEELVKEDGDHKAELSSQGLKCEEPKQEEMELIHDTKEMLEATNAKLLSDFTTIDQEIIQHEALIAKKSSIIARKKEETRHTECMLRVYDKQKVAKEVFVTRCHHENSSEHEKLADQLAKRVRVKTGNLLKFYKDEYESPEFSEVRGEPGHAEKVAKDYNELMCRYQSKMQELAVTMKEYKALAEQSKQLNGVCRGAVDETDNWKKMATAQKKKHDDLKKTCYTTLAELKVQAARKQDLANLLAESEKRAADNEKFRSHAETTIDCAMKATIEPTEQSYTLHANKVKTISIENQKRLLKIKKSRQDLRKKANNFRNLLRTC